MRWSLALRSLLWTLLIAVNLFVILYEEPALRAQFGASYEHYTRTVGRWVPRLHRGNS